MRILKRLAALTAGIAATLLTSPYALADGAANGAVGAPRPWEMGMQAAFGPLKDRILELHHLVLVIITLITLLVAFLLIWVMLRFNSRRNPVASMNSHNTVLEIAWTVIPVLILVIIAIPSFRLIYYQDRTPDPDMTVKVTGHQWYWEYTYPDQGGVDINSHYIMDEDLKPGQLRLLDVDEQMVIPVGKRIRILTNSTDVIHSFFVPSLGVQRYAIPGRTIETWLEASVPGVFYGQCNQICGENHSRMPIVIRAVPQAEFDAWVQQQKKAAEGVAKLPKIALQ
ncbi:cytochrome c oxidase subunit II [Rhodopila sp.]|jgi:cytochrome c oxidase subunit 2|uniref:cytochrome c oxidase subunit II n=1 Tax=Rhodopila sp. TaxID=2480087 RepID=UPI002CE793E2|nr:cytochrome c oxidase subunit II [Rhodopila sp.]HVZ08786.1 cytochrome c oxidase subunit II [Rhodopila sp.]